MRVLDFYIFPVLLYPIVADGRFFGLKSGFWRENRCRLWADCGCGYVGGGVEFVSDEAVDDGSLAYS